MATSALASTVVTGVVLLAILAVVFRLRRWQHPAPDVEGGADLVRAANGPLGWSVAFFVVALGLMGLAVLYTSGEPVAGLDQAALGLLVLLVLLAVFGFAGLVAVYSALRGRGLSSAQAAGVSSVLVATLLLAAIVVQLFVGG